MKKMLLIGMVSMLFTAMLGVTAADAHGRFERDRHSRHDQYVQKDNRIKDDARFVLQRTANVLQRAQDTARNDRDQRGRRGHRRNMSQRNQFKGLGFAFSLQAEACDLYQQGRYQEAIDYSLQSRAVALRTINRSQGQGWGDDEDLRRCDMDRNELDNRESGYWDRRSHESFQIHGHDVSDDDAVSFRIQFNF